jgi:hypothetical protein
MSWRSGHPDPERLASFRAGMVRASQGRKLSAHVSRCPQCALICARLDTISAALAAAPLPVLPSATEHQVIASLQGESVTREAGTLSAAVTLVPRSRLPQHSMSLLPAAQPAALGDRLAPARSDRRMDVLPPGIGDDGLPVRAVGGAVTGGRVPRGDRFSALVRGGAVAFVLALLASLGYLVRGSGLAHGAAAHAPPLPSSRPAPRTLAVGSASAALAPAAGPAAGQSAQGSGRIGEPPRTASFVVTETGTRYRRSTLRAQVRRRLADAQAPGRAAQPAGPMLPSVTGLPAAPGATESSSAGSKDKDRAGRSPRARVDFPSATLVGCVLRLTGGVLPQLVDRATYQANPAYIIEAHDEIWVVGIGCTATRPALITSAWFRGAD